MTHRRHRAGSYGLFFALFGLLAAAQEPTFMDAATHPGRGQVYSRLLLSHSQFEDNDIDLNSATLKLAYGLRPTLALLFEGEMASLSGTPHDEDPGLKLATVQAKYRLFKKDLGPLNTWRTSLFAGVGFPGHADPDDPDNPYPQVAVASTAILDRHGLNGELQWQEYGEHADRLSANASHLYRLYPAEYDVDTQGAWYTMFESLNEWTEDGDYRYDIALGLLYEARRWAWEISLRLPVEQDWKRERDYTVTIGFRVLP